MGGPVIDWVLFFLKLCLQNKCRFYKTCACRKTFDSTPKALKVLEYAHSRNLKQEKRKNWISLSLNMKLRELILMI